MVDEDEGQRAADYITQQQVDDYYARLSDEIDRNARVSSCFVWIVLAIIIIVGLLIGWYIGG